MCRVAEIPLSPVVCFSRATLRLNPLNHGGLPARLLRPIAPPNRVRRHAHPPSDDAVVRSPLAISYGPVAAGHLHRLESSGGQIPLDATGQARLIVVDHQVSHLTDSFIGSALQEIVTQPGGCEQV